MSRVQNDSFKLLAGLSKKRLPSACALSQAQKSSFAPTDSAAGLPQSASIHIPSERYSSSSALSYHTGVHALEPRTDQSTSRLSDIPKIAGQQASANYTPAPLGKSTTQDLQALCGRRSYNVQPEKHQNPPSRFSSTPPQSEELGVENSKESPTDSQTTCVCGVMNHDGRLMLDVVFEASLACVVGALFSDLGPQIYMNAMINQGAQDISSEQWSEPNNVNLPRRRHLSYTTETKQSLLGSTLTHATEKQTILQSGSGGYVFETVTKTPNVPYGSVFSIYQQLCISQNSDGQARLQIHSRVNFSRWIVLQESIRSSSFLALDEFVKILQRMILLHIEKYPENSASQVYRRVLSITDVTSPVRQLPSSECDQVVLLRNNQQNLRNRPHGPRSCMPGGASQNTVPSSMRYIEQTPYGMRIPTSPKSLSPPTNRIPAIHPHQKYSAALFKPLEKNRAIDAQVHTIQTSKEDENLVLTPSISPANIASSKSPPKTLFQDKGQSILPHLSHEPAKSVNTLATSRSREIALWDGSDWVQVVLAVDPTTHPDTPPRFITKVLTTRDGPPRLARVRQFSNTDSSQSLQSRNCNHVNSGQTLSSTTHVSIFDPVLEWVHMQAIPGDCAMLSHSNLFQLTWPFTLTLYLLSNDVFTLNVQGQLVRSQHWFWSRRTKQLYRNRYWLTPQVRPKTVKQRHSFALMETLRTCGDSASLQKYVTRQLLDTSGFFKDPIDYCILCDQQLLSTSIAHLVVECEQVTGHRIQSGLVSAIQKSRLRLLGRALDPGVENVYTWLRGGVLNGEADLDQLLVGWVLWSINLWGTRHDNRALAARLADFPAGSVPAVSIHIVANTTGIALWKLAN
ncbi:hypothetical protein BASA62_009782 [Batrachochytrium salamandrivorans]|nr:hypothetical protein BASA62_009782 [Batrachochytrium salamandrivorans]